MGELPIPVVVRRAERASHAQINQREDGSEAVVLDLLRPVIPKGVVVEPGLPNPDSAIFQSAEQLDTTIVDACRNLLTVRTAADLAAHCETYPCQELLCQHGRPTLHHDRSTDGSIWNACSGANTIVLGDVLRMTRSWEAIAEVAHHASTKRTPIMESRIDSVLAWPLLDETWWRGMLTKTVEEHDGVTVEFQKALVAACAEELIVQTGSSYRYDWLPQHGFRLTLRTGPSALGLYAACVVDRLLQAVSTAGVDRFAKCEHCGQPFQPRNSRQRFCGREACQREHRRVKKATTRARAAERAASSSTTKREGQR